MSLKQSIIQATIGWVGKHAKVSFVRTLSPHILQIRLQGEDLVGIKWSPGDKIKLHVGEGSMRSYTPSRVDAQAGWMELIVLLRGTGQSMAWASRLQVGDQVSFLGPTKSVDATTGPLPWAGFFGDETTIGLAIAIYEALPPGTPFEAWIEIDEEDRPALKACGAPLQPVKRHDHAGEGLSEHIEALSFPEGEGLIWLSGEADTVLLIRNALLEQGIPRSQMRIKPYWSRKGKAHRKRLECREFKS